MKADPKAASGRAFVRSLNILLKFARLYGYEHTRTIEQLQTAWQELRAAIPLGTDAGLLLGATGSQLLLDGVPLEGSPAEKQFAQLLSAAGLASVQFFASVTEEELGRFARAFPTGKSKPSELAQQLKSALTGAQGIRINEICFVATDARLKGASAAAQLAAASLGGEGDELKNWLNDPHKLLELLAAAQGSKGGGVIGSGPGSGSTGNGATDDTATVLAGTESSGAGEGSGAGTGGFKEEMAQLPGPAQDLLKQALASLAAQAPNVRPDESLLVQLAEFLAIRFALERFERGEVKVNAVRQMLDRMNQEIESLRKILGAHEDKMSEAGILVQSHREILDRQFWAAVPESAKRAVLLSDEAWC